MHLGDFYPLSLVVIKFTTRTAAGPATLVGGAVTVYKPAAETTTGVSLTTDFSGLTGLNHVEIDTNSAFYAAGNDFQVVLTAGTVNGVSVVGEVVGSFSIRNRACLSPTIAGRTLDVSPTGEAGIDWANVGGQTTTVSLTNTTVDANITKVMDDPIQNGAVPANVRLFQGSDAAFLGEYPVVRVRQLDDDSADRFNRSANCIYLGVANTGGTTTSITVKSITPALTAVDQVKGQIVAFRNDTATAELRGQKTDITASTTTALTVSALTVAPAENDVFVIE